MRHGTLKVKAIPINGRFGFRSQKAEGLVAKQRRYLWYAFCWGIKGR